MKNFRLILLPMAIIALFFGGCHTTTTDATTTASEVYFANSEEPTHSVVPLVDEEGLDAADLAALPLCPEDEEQLKELYCSLVRNRLARQDYFNADGKVYNSFGVYYSNSNLTPAEALHYSPYAKVDWIILDFPIAFRGNHGELLVIGLDFGELLAMVSSNNEWVYKSFGQFDPHQVGNENLVYSCTNYDIYQFEQELLLSTFGQLEKFQLPEESQYIGVTSCTICDKEDIIFFGEDKLVIFTPERRSVSCLPMQIQTLVLQEYTCNQGCANKGSPLFLMADGQLLHLAGCLRCETNHAATLPAPTRGNSDLPLSTTPLVSSVTHQIDVAELPEAPTEYWELLQDYRRSIFGQVFTETDKKAFAELGFTLNHHSLVVDAEEYNSPVLYGMGQDKVLLVAQCTSNTEIVFMEFESDQVLWKRTKVEYAYPQHTHIPATAEILYTGTTETISYERGSGAVHSCTVTDHICPAGCTATHATCRTLMVPANSTYLGTLRNGTFFVSNSTLFHVNFRTGSVVNLISGVREVFFQKWESTQTILMEDGSVWTLDESLNIYN